jgi:hypothetical protein
MVEKGLGVETIVMMWLMDNISLIRIVVMNPLLYNEYIVIKN